MRAGATKSEANPSDGCPRDGGVRMNSQRCCRFWRRLKHRQQQRGDQGQIQRTENLERKINAIIQHFKIKLPDDLDIDQAPGAMSMKRY